MFSLPIGSRWIAAAVLWSMAIGAGSIRADDGVTTDHRRLLAVANSISSGREFRIVCFGDSITGAYYHTGGQRAWCDLLGFAIEQAIPRANLEMINAGVSGHTTANALDRIDVDVLQKQPDLVVVMFGMNDVTRVPISKFRANLETIVGRCRDSGAELVLCTPNGVMENESRPNGKLAEYSQIVRAVAKQRETVCVDIFEHCRQLRDQDRRSWVLGMSDSIHPNMNGHRWFAQWIAQAITGKRISLGEIQPPPSALDHTFDRAAAGQEVHLVAMPPYDQWFATLLGREFPGLKLKVTQWPTEGRSIESMAQWAKRIRTSQPDLVVPAVPHGASGTDPDDAFIGHYEWVLNWSFPFAGRGWDVVPVCPPAASGKDQGISSQQIEQRVAFARQIIAGKDVRSVDLDALATDEQPSAGHQQRIARWISDQKRTWQAARDRLPANNDHVHLSVQPWPRNPGPRTVKVSIFYPGGQLAKVNRQTGIMLTLHNWGGTDCVGTADPRRLADRLNVVAVCVNYLQSGRPDAIDRRHPYDVGYRQGLDALRAIAFVRAGLRRAEVEYDDGRIFCTGGSGGGNVALMANKLAPRTFACLVDICGMNKLSDDIAFHLPGGSTLNARWSRDVASANYLSTDQQEIRFVGNPNHLRTMASLHPTAKVIVVHGVDDTACPVSDAREMVVNMQAAGLDVEPHFVTPEDVDGAILTGSGHALGNRTEIVFQVAQRYLSPQGPQSLRRDGPTDFDRQQDVVYPTTHGQYVISYQNGVPVGRFELASQP